MGKNKKSLSLTKHQSGHFGRKCVKRASRWKICTGEWKEQYKEYIEDEDWDDEYDDNLEILV